MITKIKPRLAAALSLLVSIGTQSVAAQTTPAPILFHTYIAGTSSQVCVVNPDGTNLKQLTAGNIGAGVPSWHPSYQYISFFRESRLWVMPAAPESKNIRPFLVGEAHVIGSDFSSDGKLIVYCGPRTTDGKGVAILVRSVDVAKKKVGPATMVWQQDCYAPSFSPDGTKILFSSHAGSTTGRPHIKVLDLVTGSVASFDSITGFIPTWSANGQSIAFCGYVTPPSEIFVMNSDFTQLTQVTSLGEGVSRPSFSPDGTHLLFTSGGPNGVNLFQVELDSAVVTLFQPGASAGNWAP
jgi:Tol biopolymer transport system component